MMRLITMAAALLLPTLATGAEQAQTRPQVGDTYEITSDRESSQQSNDGSSGSSTDRDGMIERVIGVRDDGLELEYDLPANAAAGNLASSWQFPVRVFKPARGALQLLNGPELEARVDGWLKVNGMTRAACGHWIFTWNAFRIECDPQSVIKTIEAWDLAPDDLRDGALYKDPKARGPAPLTRKKAGPDGATFAVEMAVDPEAMRREQAESDIVVAQLSKKTLTLDAALRARSAEAISGTITITFETDSAGEVQRRTRVARLETKGPGPHIETQIVKHVIERRRVSKPAPDWRRTA
ncbi:MAG: hypothetical protein ABIS51_02645 [Sphingomonas sp.]